MLGPVVICFRLLGTMYKGAPWDNSPQLTLPMSQLADQFVLPDLFAIFPFEGGQNPFFDVIGKESRDWLNSYNTLVPHHRRADFTPCELFASYCYAFAPCDVFRICVDFFSVLLMLDEISDVQDSEGARDTMHLFVRALGDDQDCDDGLPLAKMLTEYEVNRFSIQIMRTDLYLKLYGEVQEVGDSKLSTPLLPWDRCVYGSPAEGG